MGMSSDFLRKKTVRFCAEEGRKLRVVRLHALANSKMENCLPSAFSPKPSHKKPLENAAVLDCFSAENRKRQRIRERDNCRPPFHFLRKAPRGFFFASLSDKQEGFSATFHETSTINNIFWCKIICFPTFLTFFCTLSCFRRFPN